MDRSPVRDFVVGLFVLAGIAAIVYLSVSIGGFSWNGRGGLKIYAEFEETGGLTVRAPVVIAGVRVGEVSKISLSKGVRARVELNLDPNVQLHTDAEATIITAGMLGDRYIELNPGGGEVELLKAGDEISHPHSAVILERLIGQFIYSMTNSDKKDSKPATKPATH